MDARKLIDGAAFGPKTLKVVGQAFDEAWDSIAGKFSKDPLQINAARLMLANVILSIATKGIRDAAGLRAKALETMAREQKRT